MVQSSRQCRDIVHCYLPQNLLKTTLLLLCLCPIYPVLASDSSSSVDTALFGNALNREWMYNANAISIQVEGCVWGYASNHNSAYCMENGSSDGTTYWYQMANCRRAQIAYSMYATSSGNSASCNSNNFQESVRLTF
jgi:spore coat protein U-like protein